MPVDKATPGQERWTVASKNEPSGGAESRLAADLRRQREREQSYRGRALKLLPWICARCGREFSGRNLSQLTVHHKDHNHDNNPSDGSNWELLCLYCHENEHSRLEVADAYGEARPDQAGEPVSTHRPFAGLGDLLEKKKKQP